MFEAHMNTQIQRRTIFIGNLPVLATNRQIRDIFTDFGTVTRVNLPLDVATGQPRGIAFVEFLHSHSAADAVYYQRAGGNIYGWNIHVSFAHEHSQVQRQHSPVGRFTESCSTLQATGRHADQRRNRSRSRSRERDSRSAFRNRRSRSRDWRVSSVGQDRSHHHAAPQPVDWPLSAPTSENCVLVCSASPVAPSPLVAPSLAVSVSAPSTGSSNRVQVYSHALAECIDTSLEFAKSVCQPYPEERINDTEWLINEFNTPLPSPLHCSVPVGCLFHGTCMATSGAYFARNPREQANIVINTVIALEMALPTKNTIMSAASVQHLASILTGIFWGRLGALCRPEVKFRYTLNNTEINAPTCTTSRSTSVDVGRPDETGYVNGIFLYMAEHHEQNLSEAIKDIESKIVDYNCLHYGKIRHIPVCVAADTRIQFGLVDLVHKKFIPAYEYDLNEPYIRAGAIHASIKVFKYIALLASIKLPQPALTLFWKKGRVEMRLDANHNAYVSKDFDGSDTAPDSLYQDFLSHVGEVGHELEHTPCVNVTKEKNRYRITPCGHRTYPDCAGLTADQVRNAIRSVLHCLVDLHRYGYVHRDIRWANIIALYSYDDSHIQTLERFLLIDFEFAGKTGEVLQVPGHWYHQHVAISPQPFHERDDLWCVADLLRLWAVENRVFLHEEIQECIGWIRSSPSAAVALQCIWLSE